MKNKINIAYIISMKTGIARFIYRELEEIEKRGFSISIFSTKYNNNSTYLPKDNWFHYNFNKYLALMKQPIYFLKYPKKYLELLFEAIKSKSLIDFILANEFSSVMLKRKINRIHCHFGDRKLFIGYYCKKILEVPLTVTIHAIELYQNPNVEMFKKALSYCNNIIAISEYNKKYLIDNFNADPKKIEVIRLFVDTKKIHLTNLRKILVVGCFEERKGYDTLLKAISLLKRNDFVLWIVGEGYLPVKEWAKELKIDDKIKFFDQLHADILDILFRSCDFFVLPSKTVKVKKGIDAEGIPVVLMEAMAIGKPIISTKHRGIPELVEKILVKENDANELAKAINYLLDNPQLYEKMGIRNIRIINKKYSPKNIEKLIGVFND